MNKKRAIRFSILIINILLIFLLIWSFINYQVLDQEVTNLVKFLGLSAMVLFVIFLEGAPVFVGPSVAVASVLAMNVFNPVFIFWLFLGSAFLGNVIYYYLGYFFGNGALKYFDKKDVRKYEKFFKKYGGLTMITMAISPVPYLPTFAGVFRMNSVSLISKILILRAIRHTIVFFFWLFVLTKF